MEREREREWCCLECKEGEGVEVVPCVVFGGWVEQVRKSLLLRFTLIMQQGDAWKLLMLNNILYQSLKLFALKILSLYIIIYVLMHAEHKTETSLDIFVGTTGCMSQ